MAKIWLTVLLLTLVVGGCRRAPGEAERRLMAIDSLVAVAPDSALALLADIDTATLAEPDRAYHALLQTQAMYKAGIPVDDSTLICRAQRYYADHGPVDRQIRAMCYRASVAEDLGDPELAMRWYKLTELTAREHGDDYNTAYALMSMGVLYQANFEDSLALVRFRQTVNLIPDSCYYIREYCYYQLSQLYQLRNNGDSALFFIRSLTELTHQTNDTMMTAFALSSEAGKWFYDSCYQKAKDIAVYAIHHYTEFIPYICWNYAIQSYALLGMTDSADHYLNMSPPASNAVDSTQFLHSKSLICELKKQWKEAHRFEVMSDSLAEATMWIAERPKLYQVERQTAALVQQENKRFSSTVILVVLLVFFSTLIYLLVRLYRKRKDLIEHAKWLEADHLQLTSLQDMQSNALKSTQAKLDEQILETKRLQENLREKETFLAAQRAETESNAKQSENEIQSLKDEIDEINQAMECERKQARQLITAHIDKLRRIIDTSQLPVTKEYVMKLQKEAKINAFEESLWLSDDSTMLIEPEARAAYEQILSQCTLTKTETMVLKMAAMDFSDEQIRILMGASTEDYARTVLSRIKNKNHMTISIRKTFRNLNNTHR